MLQNLRKFKANKMSELSKKVANTDDKDSKLPAGTAEISQEQKMDPEVTPYVISFAKYDKKMHKKLLGKNKRLLLDKNQANDALEKLIKVGTEVYSNKDFQRKNIDFIPVKRDGAYKELFRGLEDDIDLREIKIQGKARIFYFVLEVKRTFYVIAITKDHLETDKVRR